MPNAPAKTTGHKKSAEPRSDQTASSPRSGLSATPTVCTYSSGWNVNPAVLEAAGTDWIWFGGSCSPTSTGGHNYIVYSFETCPTVVDDTLR